MDRTQDIQREIWLHEDEGCVILDLACLWRLSKRFLFTFSITPFNTDSGEVGNTIKTSDFILTHRYPNKGYYTVSKIMGRRVSELGYPYIINLNGPKSFFLNITVPSNITLKFLVTTKLTLEKPYSVLTFFDEMADKRFSLQSFEKAEHSNGWVRHTWSNYQLEDNSSNGDYDHILGTPTFLNKENTVLYYPDEIILPASKLEDLLFLY